MITKLNMQSYFSGKNNKQNNANSAWKSILFYYLYKMYLLINIDIYRSDYLLCIKTFTVAETLRPLPCQEKDWIDTWPDFGGMSKVLKLSEIRFSLT